MADPVIGSTICAATVVPVDRGVDTLRLGWMGHRLGAEAVSLIVATA